MGETTVEDDAESYLRLASKLKWKHFARGHNSVSQKQGEVVGENPANCPSKPPMRLPMKKPRRIRDSDSDDERGTAPRRDAAEAPSISSFSSSPSFARKPCNGAPITLMEKWFPGSTLGNATLDAAEAPTPEYTDLTMARMNVVRERFLTLRGGVEDVLKYAVANGDGDFTEDRADWDWRALRDTLSQLTSRDVFRTKKRVVRAVQWLLANKPSSISIPKRPTVRLWERYLNEHGPECGHMPPLSLLVWLDSARTTALFAALVDRTLRFYKQGMKAAMHTSQKVDETIFEVSENTNVNDDKKDEEEVDEEDEEEDLQPHNARDENIHGTNEDSKQLLFFTQLTPLYGGGAREEIISLLSFLRVFMPVDAVDASGNVVGRSVGHGIWLYACLSAVDTPLEPDLDRLVHEFFRICCQQIRTLGEVHGIRGGNRGAIVHAFSPRSGDTTTRREYNSIDDVRKEDVLALHTIIIILAKLFRQNQNRLIPL
ncbi:putative Gem-associated protein 2 [Trypanosoma cruzi]|nr:putative Gem-associated protein 2 [Trypanosoma cruzi]